MNTANIFAPVGLAEGLVDALGNWQEISGVEFDYRVFGAAPGAVLELRGDVSVRAFPTMHRLETLGYLFERTTKRLKAELKGRTGDEIRRLRANGSEEDLFETVRTPLVAYVPDTLPEALDEMPSECWEAQLLIVEATFLDDRKPMEKIRQGGHVHLNDIIERLERFRGEHVVLFHFSRSYRTDEIIELLDEKIPAEWRSRVLPFV